MWKGKRKMVLEESSLDLKKRDRWQQWQSWRMNKKEEAEALGAILSFFNHLFASVNLKILFCVEAILDF